MPFPADLPRSVSSLVYELPLATICGSMQRQLLPRSLPPVAVVAAYIYDDDRNLSPLLAPDSIAAEKCSFIHSCHEGSSRATTAAARSPYRKQRIDKQTWPPMDIANRCATPGAGSSSRSSSSSG